MVHLNSDAIALLTAARRMPRTPQVITYKGQPVNSIKTAWKGACRRAGVTEHRFHDLRATFCTALAAQPGVTMNDIREAAGHRSPVTTARYLRSSDQRQKAAIEGVTGVFPAFIPPHKGPTQENRNES